jgi:hypothetical protein
LIPGCAIVALDKTFGSFSTAKAPLADRAACADHALVTRDHGETLPPSLALLEKATLLAATIVTLYARTRAQHSLWTNV